MTNSSKQSLESRLSKLEERKSGSDPLDIEAIFETIRLRHEYPEKAREEMRRKYGPRIEELDESDFHQSLMRRIMIKTIKHESLHA